MSPGFSFASSGLMMILAVPSTTPAETGVPMRAPSGLFAYAKSPEGALIGTPVSAGVVEGTARIIIKPEDAKLNPGDILVAPYTTGVPMRAPSGLFAL